MEPTLTDITPPRRSRQFLIAILFVAAILRIVGLNAVPPGMNQDEAIHAWDAWCLLKTGMDHGGHGWPVFCEAFGLRESHAAPFVYLLIPFQAVLGMNVWSTRLPSAIAGIVAVALVYCFVARTNRRMALWAALLLAISPWHIHLSRLAFEVSICPTLLLLGLVLLNRAADGGDDQGLARIRWRSAFAAGVVLGLLAWTYNAYRVFVPMFAAGLIAVWWIRIASGRARLRGLAISAVGFLIGASPFIVACVSTPEKAWGRARGEFVMSKAASVGEGLAAMATTYWHQISPVFLFVSGDPSLVQSVPNHGQLYYVVGLFMLVGLVCAIRRWRDLPLGRIVLVWILLSPIPASLTTLSSGHALRAATVIPAYEILAAIGVEQILRWLAKWKEAGRHALRIIIALALAGSTARFTYLFFAEYPHQAGPSFWEESRPLFTGVAQRRKDYDLVLLSPSECPQNGTLYLFHTSADPRTFFETPKRYWHGKDWDSLIQYGNVYFAYYRNLPIIIRESYADRKELRVLVAERPEVPVQGELLKTFHYADGREAMRLYEMRVSIGSP